jgi:hypothetical protein
MFGYEKIGLNFSLNYIYLVIGIIILSLYSYFVYRYTLPPVSYFKKYILLFLRSIALISLLFIFFEPVLTLTKKEIITPSNLFFFDNSRSIKIDDGTNRIATMENIIEEISNKKLNGRTEYFSFGSKVKQINKDSLKYLNFSEPATNFACIFNNLNHSSENISSVTIVSDGVITEGSTPNYTAQKLGIPVFTIGIGDSAKKNDVEIMNVIHNDFIYAETQTTILVTFTNKGYANKRTVISFFEDNQLLEQKNISLDESGVNTISFDYTPKQSGEKKLTVKINPLEGEATTSNNQKVFYINVLSNKINVLLISGSPSSDLTFIKNTLSNDSNLRVNTLTQITPDKFLENNANTKLDSADIIYLIGYPTNMVNEDFYSRLINKLNNQNIPLFFVLTGDVSISKLDMIKNLLPFSIQKIENNYFEVQPNIQVSGLNNPIVKGNTISDWDNLPPVDQPLTILNVNPESNVISTIKIGNAPRANPLILSRNFGSKRSIAVLAKDIWKWKLQTANKDLTLFDNFIINSARWLNAPEDKKRVRISTSKKIYSIGEPVEFSAQVYDESFNPVNDAEVKLNIIKNDFKSELMLNSIGNGLYEGEFQPNQNGDFSFSGSAIIDGKILGSDKGSFNVGDVEIEFLNTRMDYPFLNSLSVQSDGKYFEPNQIKDLLKKVDQLNLRSSKEKLNVSEIRLWSDEWLLVIIILLFSLEWFLRKRSGML